jgi:hypothetical protein
MIPIGLALALAGYAAGMWGYCLVRDYNVSFAGLFDTTWPGATSTATPSTATAPTPSGTVSINQQLTQ